jgi:hypothetical protein
MSVTWIKITDQRQHDNLLNVMGLTKDPEFQRARVWGMDLNYTCTYWVSPTHKMGFCAEYRVRNSQEKLIRARFAIANKKDLIPELKKIYKLFAREWEEVRTYRRQKREKHSPPTGKGAASTG